MEDGFRSQAVLACLRHDRSTPSDANRRVSNAAIMLAKRIGWLGRSHAGNKLSVGLIVVKARHPKDPGEADAIRAMAASRVELFETDDLCCRVALTSSVIEARLLTCATLAQFASPYQRPHVQASPSGRESLRRPWRSATGQAPALVAQSATPSVAAGE
jgi:hypothetical protein